MGKLNILIRLFFIFGLTSAEKCINKSNAKLFCYYGKIQSVDNCKCTHVILPSNSDVKSIEKLKQSVDGVKILVTVHEFNEGFVELLKNSKVDGLEIDLKKIDSKDDIGDFITTARSKLGSDLITVVSVPARGEILAKFYDFKSLTKHVDAFVLQTAFLGASKNLTFHPSRLSGLWDMQNADSVVDLVTGLGAPLSKLVISAPVQAFQFKLQNGKHTAVGSPALEIKSISRDELCEKMSNFNWTLERDQDQAGPYIFRKDEWIAFDDDTSVDIKAKYTRVRGLLGLALKDLSQDGDLKRCGYTLLDSAHRGLSKQARAPRGAVLHSLEREILDNSGGYSRSDHIRVSPYRISRIIDVEGKIHTVRQDTRTEFACSRQGYFVHPRSCNRFYRCVKFDQQSEDFNVFEFDCPAGLAFDERVEVCVWPGSLPHGSPCAGSSEIAPVPKERYVCPHEPGYYADPENCRWFFACLDHGNSEMTPYEFRCPFGLVFDQERLVCEWPWLVPKCFNGYAGIHQPSVVVYGGNSLENYNGLGVLQPISLGGVVGRIEGPINKVYSSFGNNGNVGYGGLGLGTVVLQHQGKIGEPINKVYSNVGTSENIGYDDFGSGTVVLQRQGTNEHQGTSGNAFGLGKVVLYDQGKINAGEQYSTGLKGSVGRTGDSKSYSYHTDESGNLANQNVDAFGGGVGDTKGFDVFRTNDGYRTASTGEYNKNFFASETGDDFKDGLITNANYDASGQNLEGSNRGKIRYQTSQLSDGYLANNNNYDGNAKSYFDFGFSTGGFSHGLQAGNNYNQFGTKNVDIVAGGFSAVKNYDQGTVSPIVSVSATPSSIPTVTSVPLPSKVDVFQGGVIANIPELQVKVQSPNEIVFHGNVSETIKKGYPYETRGYVYPKPLVRFEEGTNRGGSYSYQQLNKKIAGIQTLQAVTPSVLLEQPRVHRIRLRPQLQSKTFIQPARSFSYQNFGKTDVNQNLQTIVQQPAIEVQKTVFEGVTPSVLIGKEVENITPTVLLEKQHFPQRQHGNIEAAKEVSKFSFGTFGKTDFGAITVDKVQPKYNGEVHKPVSTYSYQQHFGGYNNQNVDAFVPSVTPAVLIDQKLDTIQSVTPSSILIGGINVEPQHNVVIQKPVEVQPHYNVEIAKPVSTFNFQTLHSNDHSSFGKDYKQQVDVIQSVTPSVLIENKPLEVHYNVGVEKPVSTYNFQTFGKTNYGQKVDAIQAVAPSVLVDSQENAHYTVGVQKPVSYSSITFGKNDYKQRVVAVPSVTPSVLIADKENVDIQPHYNVEVSKPASTYNLKTQKVTPSILIENKPVEVQPQYNVEIENQAFHKHDYDSRNDYKQQVDTVQSVTPSVLVGDTPVDVQPIYNVGVRKPVSAYSFQRFGKTDYGQKVDSFQSVTPSVLIENKLVEVQPVEVEKPISTFNLNTFHKNDYDSRNDYKQQVDNIQSVTPSVLVEIQPQYNVEAGRPVSKIGFQTFHKQDYDSRNDYKQQVDTIQSVTPSVLIEDKPVDVQPYYNVEIKKPVSTFNFQTFHKNDQGSRNDYKQHVDNIQSVTPSVLVEVEPHYNVESEKPISKIDFQTFHKQDYDSRNDYKQQVDTIQSVTPSILIEDKPVDVQPYYNVEIKKPVSTFNFQTFHKNDYTSRNDYRKQLDNVQSVTPSVLVEVQPQYNVEAERPSSKIGFQTFHKQDYDSRNDYKQQVDTIQSVTPSVLIENKLVDAQPYYNVETKKPVSTFNFQTFHKNDYASRNDYNQQADNIQSVTPSVLVDVQPQYNIEAERPASKIGFQTFHKQDYDSRNDYKQQVDTIQSVTPTVLIEDKPVDAQPYYNVEIKKPVSTFNFQTFHKNDYASRNDYNQQVDNIQSVTPSVLVDVQPQYNIEAERPASKIGFQTFHKQDYDARNDYKQQVDTIQSVTPTVLIEDKPVEAQPYYNVEIKKPVSTFNFQTFHKNDYASRNDYNQQVDNIQSVTPSVLVDVQPQYNIEAERPASKIGFQTLHKQDYESRNDYKQQVDTIQSVTPTVLIEDKPVEAQPYYNVEIKKPVSTFNFQTFHKNDYASRNDYNQQVDNIQSVTPSVLVDVQPQYNIEAERPASKIGFQTFHKHDYDSRNDYKQQVDTIQSVTPTVLIEDKSVDAQPYYNVEFKKPVSTFNFQTSHKNDYASRNDYNQQVGNIQSVTPSVLVDVQAQYNVETEKPTSKIGFQTFHKQDYDSRNDYKQQVDTVQSVTPSVLIEDKPNYNIQVNKPASAYSFQTFGNTGYGQKVDTVQSVTPSVVIENRPVEVQPDYKVEVQKPISSFNFQTLHKNDYASRNNYNQQQDIVQSVTPSVLIEDKPIEVQPHYNVETKRPVSAYSFQTNYGQKVNAIETVTPLGIVQPQYTVEVEKPVSTFNVRTFLKDDYASFNKNDYNQQVDNIQSVTPSVLIDHKPISSYSFQSFDKEGVDTIQTATPSISIEDDNSKKVDTLLQSLRPSVLIENKEGFDSNYGQGLSVIENVKQVEVQGEGTFGQKVGNKDYDAEVQKPVSTYNFPAQVSEGYDYKKPSSNAYFKFSFGTQVDQNQSGDAERVGNYDYSSLQPVTEEPFVKKTAYITGDHYYDQKSKLAGTYSISSTPNYVETTPTEKVLYTPVKPTYQTLLTNSQKLEPSEFYFYDSRLSSTLKPSDVISTTSTGRKYLPPKTYTAVKTTTSRPYLEVTTPYVEVTSAPLKETVVENYENAAFRRPVKIVKIVRPKSKAIVKINDFYPMLSAKLGAQCTCVSNTLNLRKRPETNSKYYDTIDSEDDGYVVEGYQSNSNDYEPQKVVEITQIPVVRKRVKVTTASYDIPDKTKAIEVFTIQPYKDLEGNVDDGGDGEPTEKEVKQAVKTGLKLIKSAARQGAKEGTKEVLVDFDRFGPGGVRSRLETLQGINCQRAGLFRHPNQCNKFYSCVYDCDKKKFKLHIFNCPVHLTFDSNLGACNWPSQGPACMGNTLLPSE